MKKRTYPKKVAVRNIRNLPKAKQTIKAGKNNLNLPRRMGEGKMQVRNKGVMFGRKPAQKYSKSLPGGYKDTSKNGVRKAYGKMPKAAVAKRKRTTLNNAATKLFNQSSSK